MPPIILGCRIEGIHSDYGGADSAGADLGDADRVAEDRPGVHGRAGCPRKPENKNRALARMARGDLLSMLGPQLDFAHTKGVEAGDLAPDDKYVGRNVAYLPEGSPF